MSNNRPLSFRDMSFPKARDGKIAVYAPLPPTQSPKTISQEEKDKRIAQFLEMKRFCNEQRCAVCQAQLDGTVRFDEAHLYCVSHGEDEYKVIYKFGCDLPISATTIIYCTHYAFEIVISLLADGIYINQVFKLDLSLNKRIQQKEKKKLFSYEGKPFMIEKGFSEEKILQKIKIYTCFS